MLFSSPDYPLGTSYERPIDNATCWDLPVEGHHVIGVSALGPSTAKADYSNYGLEQISRQAGVSQDEASRGLSQLLPEVVDRMTPDGEVPDADALANSVDDFARRFGLS